MEKKFFIEFFLDFSLMFLFPYLVSLEEIEERRGLLLKLKELLLRNMGNKEIDERLFINIVDRIEKLKLDIL